MKDNKRIPPHHRKIFVTFFPYCQNEHLTKDVGLIPYILKHYYQTNSFILTYNNDNYTRLEREVPGLKLIFLKDHIPHFIQRLGIFKRFPKLKQIQKVLGLFFDSLHFFIQNRKKIDILQVYGFRFETLYISILNKIFNPRGFTYIKIDTDLAFFQKTKRIFQLLEPFYALISRIGIKVISIEIKELQRMLKKDYPLFHKYKNILCIPNGIIAERYAYLAKSPQDKENIILHVGRIGHPSKASPFVVKAFLSLYESFPNWKLMLIGKMESWFEKRFRKLLEKKPELKERLMYVGFLNTREELFQYYARSKILAMPSRVEAFPLAAVEAGFFGNIIVSSNMLPFFEITNSGKFGFFSQINNLEEFTLNLKKAILDIESHPEKSQNMKEFINENYDWIKICGKLNKIFSLMLEEHKM